MQPPLRGERPVNGASGHVPELSSSYVSCNFPRWGNLGKYQLVGAYLQGRCPRRPIRYYDVQNIELWKEGYNALDNRVLAVVLAQVLEIDSDILQGRVVGFVRSVGAVVASASCMPLQGPWDP